MGKDLPEAGEVGFTSLANYDILKADIRCPDCGKLLMHAFAYKAIVNIPVAVAVEVKCHRCGCVISYPAMAIPPPEED